MIMTRFEAIAVAQYIVDEDKRGCEDIGTCVLGAGIYLKSDPWGKYGPTVVIRSPFQGNVGGYRACKRAIAYLNSQGFKADWYDGAMD